jgi:regulator of replication initiation timing
MPYKTQLGARRYNTRMDKMFEESKILKFKYAKYKRVIKVETMDKDSIKKAEKMKVKLENQGYELISTNPIGFGKFELRYIKN